MTVQDFKLVCISTKEFTDAQVAVLMPTVTINSAEEVTEFMRILRKHRPNLADRFFKDGQL